MQLLALNIGFHVLIMVSLKPIFDVNVMLNIVLIEIIELLFCCALFV